MPEVLTYAPNCPEPTALKAIRDAARLLCKRTNIWRDTDEFQVTTPDCEGICTIPDASIHEIQSAELNDVDLLPKTIAWLDEHRPRWKTETEVASVGRFITQLAPNTVTIVPKAAGLLRARLILHPSRRATTIPEFLVEQYGQEIGKGAAGAVLLIPGELFQPDLGAALTAAFEAKLSTIKTTTEKGQVGARLRTKGSYF
nr:hypothetical protein [Aminobacter sp. MDW-2]